MSLSFEEVRAWAEERATHWAHDPNGVDLLEIDGIPVASALRIEAFNLLMPLALATARVTSDFGTPGIAGLLKRGGVDRAVRALGLRVTGRGSGRTDRTTDREVVFLSEFAAPSLLEPMQRVARHIDRSRWIAVCADPRTIRAWSRPGLHGRADDVAVRSLTLPWRDERRVLRDATQRAAERWDAIVSRRPAFRLDGADLSRIAMGRLERLVRRSVPWLAVETEAMRRWLEAARPRWLVVASDQHRIGRVAVGEARQRGVRSLVLQHGLPQYALGYVPVVADAVATWSEAADAWFRRQGTPPDRLVRLGNPRVDALADPAFAAGAASVADRFAAAGSPRILVTLSPSDRERNRAIVRIALDVVGAERTANVVVKLHPGDGRWDDVRRLIRSSDASRGRVIIARREPLYPFLAWADAVFLDRSTVALESLAAGVPVALYGGGSAEARGDLDPGIDLPTVSTAAELAAFAAHVADPTSREEFVATRRPALERSVGPVDGGAARRIADFLASR